MDRSSVVGRIAILVVASTFACAQGEPAAERSSSAAAAPADVGAQRAPDSTTPTRDAGRRLSSVEMIPVLRASDTVMPPREPGPGVYRLYNPEAVIPPQCYTKHEAEHNVCYVCHQNHVEGRENRQNDGGLQLAYSFSDAGMVNRWSNLFEDRRARVAEISDAEILDWISQDNFSELAGRLRAVGFRGYVPKLDGLADGAAAFDRDGFAKDGSGWVAFNFKPFPSTFWPTNGSTDDVMIRLPESFRATAAGEPSRDVYRANLALTEAAIKGFEAVSSLPIDERALGEDADGDGAIGTATRVAMRPRYFGGASGIAAEAYVYPQGVEFLHTVRYVGVDERGEIGNSRRMKEVRYMRKQDRLSKLVLGHYYNQEYTDKDEGTLPHYPNYGHAGLYNKMGWLVQSFVEGHDGRLRFATYEENMFCMGCHNTVGSTIDKTFSFPRKVDGAAGWGYIDLRAMADVPSMGETQGEIATYLERAGGGSEFRNNEEMAERWYRSDGTVDREAVSRAATVYELIVPSRERALALNKAYRAIVEDQDFIYGRDATLVAPENVYAQVDMETAPVLPAEKFFVWDIRLDWGRAPARAE